MSCILINISLRLRPMSLEFAYYSKNAWENILDSMEKIRRGLPSNSFKMTSSVQQEILKNLEALKLNPDDPVAQYLKKVLKQNEEEHMRDWLRNLNTAFVISHTQTATLIWDAKGPELRIQPLIPNTRTEDLTKALKLLASGLPDAEERPLSVEITALYSDMCEALVKPEPLGTFTL